MSRPWLKKIDLTKRVLEIGPLTNPNVKKATGAHVFYIDIRSTEEVKKFYGGDPNVPNDAIVDIDYVLGEGTYSECLKDVEKFDYVVSSHVLEHEPRLIAFFQDISNVLQPEGKLCFAIPDKRYCFDRFRCPTSFAECYDIYQRRIKNSPLRVLDHLLSWWPTNDSGYWWDNKNSFDQLVHTKGRFTSAQDGYLKALDGAYLDVHFSVFTPETFLILLFNMLNSSLLPFKCVEFYDTEHYSNEFNCVLELAPGLLADGIEREKENENLIRLLNENLERATSSALATNAAGAVAPSALPQELRKTARRKIASLLELLFGGMKKRV